MGRRLERDWIAMESQGCLTATMMGKRQIRLVTKIVYFQWCYLSIGQEILCPELLSEDKGPGALFSRSSILQEESGAFKQAKRIQQQSSLSMEDIFCLMKIVGWQGVSANLDTENRNICLDKNIQIIEYNPYRTHTLFPIIKTPFLPHQVIQLSRFSNIYPSKMTTIFLQICSMVLCDPSPKDCPSNNFIYKMQINLCTFEQHLSRRDKKDLYCRPITALISAHTRTHTTDQIFNLSFLAKRKESHGYTTRVTTSDKKAYRNIRSASLYETLYPQMAQDRSCKLQVINNTCIKKVFLSKGKPFRRGSTVYDVNATLSQHITEQDHTKKENQLPKYHCKKLKVIRGKPKIGRIHSQVDNEEDAWGKPEGVTIIGTKIL